MKWPPRFRSRSLLSDLLGLQLAILAAVGLLALGGLYWTSRTVIDDNLEHWARQWAGELNELGAPLYMADGTAAMLDVERFAAKFPEIRSVDWYDANGAPLRAFTGSGEEPGRLDRAVIDSIRPDGSADSAFVLIRDPETPLSYRLVGSIWTERTLGDGLLAVGADPSIRTQTELLGFVGLDIDFSWYRQQFLPKLGLASLALLALLCASWIVGRQLIRRALAPLLELQRPLADLASGNMDVTLPDAPHHEIRTVIDALEDTRIKLKERDRRLVHLAMHDSLTGLFNRHRFVTELEAETARVRETKQRSAVLFVDLDQFKYVNDTCGHPAGDELLKLAARCISSAVRATDVVSRFGGDEFAVLLKDVSRQHARRIAGNILEQMRSLTHLHDGKAFSLQCSIGGAEINGESNDPHELLSKADLACHVAKSNGRNRVEFFRSSLRESRQMTRDIDWVKHIRDALERDAFTLHFQPIAEIRTGAVRHYEALLRLRNSDGTLTSPQVFLPAATRFGLLPSIDRWVVEHALAKLAAVREHRPDISFSINLSATTFDESDLVGVVRAALRQHDLPGEAVIFELTEQEAIRFALHTAKQMNALKELGCRVAIDDFGTGYSSFAYLKRLPVDYLKIDGSFIRGIERDAVDQTMVRLIGEVAKAADIRTIAEYVQSAGALTLLKRFGIDYAQGFHVGKPVEAPFDDAADDAPSARTRRDGHTRPLSGAPL